MNAFNRHGIYRLSYSHMDMFRTDPAAWLMRYPLKYKGGSNPNMARGNAVEHGLEQYLLDEFGVMGLTEATEAAEKHFMRETALMPKTDAREAALKAIPGWMEQAIEAFAGFGKCVSSQNKLTLNLEDVPVEIVGYDDFEFQGDPMLSVDLKTTIKLPSKISDNHKRQGALYQAMRPNHKIMFCYVTPKKWAAYEIDPVESIELVEDFRISAKKMERLLSLTNDSKELADIFAPSYSSFYWSDPIMRAEAKRIFGV